MSAKPNPAFSRRGFLIRTAQALAIATFPLPRLRATPAPPPWRVVTRGPRFHWRGYYDKLLFSHSDRYLLANTVAFEHRSPTADDELRVGMIDLRENDRWLDLGVSRAWNWQQGCMLQWLPGHHDEVLWNDREENHFVAHILNVHTGKRRTLPCPFYCVSPNGRWALAPDFRRLNDTRPGYGYPGLPDPHAEHPAPDNAGIWKIDLATGRQELLISFAQAAAILFPGGYSRGAKHWFNHLLFNTDGSRFLFLHRWRGEAEGKSFATRMFTADLDGRNLHILDPHGKTSHFVWRDPRHVMAWAWHPSHGDRFYLYRDRTDHVEVVGPEVMTRNGHNTFLPRHKNQWVLNDTYPDKNRLQHPYLFHIPSGRRIELGEFLSPSIYNGEWRCDLHPCASPNGRLVSLDSPAPGGGRQVQVLDVSRIL